MFSGSPHKADSRGPHRHIAEVSEPTFVDSAARRMSPRQRYDRSAASVIEIVAEGANQLREDTLTPPGWCRAGLSPPPPTPSPPPIIPKRTTGGVSGISRKILLLFVHQLASQTSVVVVVW